MLAPFSDRQKYFLILIGFFLLYIYLFISGLPEDKDRVTICLFKNITGYPCGACGTTRGLKYLVHGHFWEAFMMNPLSYLTVGFTIISTVWIFRDLRRNSRSYFAFFQKKIHWSLVVLISVFTLANWIWNIYKGN